MSDRLPAGWAWATLEDLKSHEPNAFTDGPFGSKLKTEHYADDGVRVVRLGNIGVGHFDSDDTAYITLTHFEQLRKHEVFPGDLLIAALADPVGRCCEVPLNLGKAIVKADCIRFKPASEIDRRIIMHWLNSPRGRQAVESLSHGLGRLRINMRDLRSVPVPIPPLPEQRRIAERIESLFARSARARDGLSRIAKLVERYRQAVLEAAFSKAKSSDDFIPISDLIETLDQGWSPKCDNEPSDDDKTWAVIKTTAIQAIDFLPHENKRLPSLLEPRLGLEIKIGDVLITRAGPRSRVGICCVVKSTRPRLMLCDKAYRIRVRPEVVDPAYLAMMLNSPPVLDRIEEMKTGISDSGLNLTQDKFLKLPVPCIPIVRQRALVRRIDNAFVQIARIVEEAATASRLLGRLDQSVLDKAFAGELVPQDRADEPAAVLLERIKVARADAPSPRRGCRSISKTMEK